MSRCFYTHCWRLLILSIVVLIVGHSSLAHANTFTVNSTADMVDTSPGDGKCDTGRDAPEVVSVVKECTLRAAIQEANALSGKHEIILAPGTYLLSRPTQCAYRVKGNPNFLTDTAVSLCITGQMVISGSDANTTFIDGAQLARTLFVSADAQAEIRGTTIQRGNKFGINFDFGRGGGIDNHGMLTLIESVVSGNNSDSGGGGGIFNTGTLILNKSKVINNTAIPNLGDGGGIYNNEGTTIITDSLVSGNTAGNGGGGLANYIGTVTITGSTFSNNVSDNGGGITNYFTANDRGALTLTNSTISGNRSTRLGGGLNNYDMVKLNNVTITQNRSGRAGGGISNGGTLTLKNTLIAGNTNDTQEAPDCYSPQPLMSQGHNLIQNTTFCSIAGDQTGNITGQDARLGVLANNGGLTQTHALLSDSPAIDAGDPATPGSGGMACAAIDQGSRVLRPRGNACDIGAFERESVFSVKGSLPNRGGNTASVIATVSGNGFKDGATVKLRRTGEPDINGTPVSVEAGGSSLSTSFDLNGRALGAWDVVVTNSDGTSVLLSNGFTIEETKSLQLWSQIVGRSSVRRGLPAKYNIIYGNRGNVDAYAVPLTLIVPANLQLNVYFQIAPPPTQPQSVPTDWSEVDVDVLPDKKTDADTNVLLLLPVIPAGSTSVLRILLTLPPDAPHGDTLTFAAYLGDSYFTPNFNPKILDEIVAGAQSYSQRALGVTIPPALIPDLKQYAMVQYQSLVASGRQSLVTSFTTQPEVYSLAQLNIDLAQFGAARATNGNVQSIASSKSDTDQASASSIPPISPLAGGSGGKPNGCSGQILVPGTTCGDNPTPIPTPDKQPPGPPGIPKGDCNQIPNHQLSSDGKSCIPSDRRGCPTIPTPFFTDPNCATYPIRNSVDPNDKVGTPGSTDKRFRQSTTPFIYSIFFENLPTATAPAQVVTITDQLDTSNIDLSTFSLGAISFGGYTVLPPPGQSEYVTALDLRPARDLVVKIDARLDKLTRLLTWRFTSLDPATLQPTEDPDAGFLPPNRTSPEGDGSVTFTVQPKSNTALNTEIRNRARIVFDVNAPIDTPEWLNTIDDSRPTSRVTTSPRTRNPSPLVLRWAGADTGAGINDYTIFVSENGAPFSIFLANTTATTAVFTGRPGSTYFFYSIATDGAGNREEKQPTADVTIKVGRRRVFKRRGSP